MFHIDRVGMRLLTTYYGAGTEWLKNSDVKRAGLGKGDDSLVQEEGSRIHVIEPGAVALMKGEKDNDGFGFVHRSPRIEEYGGKRVLLRMDTLA